MSDTHSRKGGGRPAGGGGASPPATQSPPLQPPASPAVAATPAGGAAALEPPTLAVLMARLTALEARLDEASAGRSAAEEAARTAEEARAATATQLAAAEEAKAAVAAQLAAAAEAKAAAEEATRLTEGRVGEAEVAKGQSEESAVDPVTVTASHTYGAYAYGGAFLPRASTVAYVFVSDTARTPLTALGQHQEPEWLWGVVEEDTFSRASPVLPAVLVGIG